MNKRQLETEKAKLTDEEAVLKNLRKHYDHALLEINSKIKDFQGDIKSLTKMLEKAVEAGDTQNELIIRSRIQSKVYRKSYQENLQKQVNGIIENIEKNQYKSIQDYLTGCYDTGYISTMYDIAGQGIPLILPIEQRAVLNAVMLDSDISGKLYGGYTALLKKKIQSEISRGLATGMTYRDMARNLRNQTKITENQSMRIIRTEGHRIQQISADDARRKARAAGADVVKQWDSTLDGRTRPTHRKLDGQIRELDEPFEVDGKKAMYPGGFKRPEEDINCRCIALQRAKWALNESELETLKERAAFFGLDKTKDFNDFKAKYLKAVKGLGTKDNSNFDIPEHKKPEIINKIDFNDNNAVKFVIDSFEKSAIKESVETACVITKSGTVYKCFGIADRVFIDSDLGDKLKGAKVSHNHPIEETEYSFSNDDLKLFMQYELETLRGCDEKYTYELNRIPNEEYEMNNIFEMTEENSRHEWIMMKAEEFNFGYKRWEND